MKIIVQVTMGSNYSCLGNRKYFSGDSIREKTGAVLLLDAGEAAKSLCRKAGCWAAVCHCGVQSIQHRREQPVKAPGDKRPLERQQSLYTFTVCVIVLEAVLFHLFSFILLFQSTFCSMNHCRDCHANFRHRRSPSFLLRFEIASAFQPTFVISEVISDQPLRRPNLCHQLIILTFLATFTSR